MCDHYKYPEKSTNINSKMLIDHMNCENLEETHKSFIEIDENIINCFKNILVAYKSGNLNRLSNHLSLLNNITIDNYFEPIPEFFNTGSNSISEILIKIAFDKSNNFSVKCNSLSLSIIENLTFEEQYGFIDMFYELDIIHNIHANLSSEKYMENLILILHSLRILINFAESQKYLAEEILVTCPLNRFLEFILNTKNEDRKLEMRIKYYTVSLLCKLSFVSSDKFTPCFYASVDSLLHQTALFDEENNVENFIFWICINCIDSDDKCVDQFIENDNLINLIIETIHNPNDNFSNFQYSLILLDKLYHKFDFIILELDISNLMSSIQFFNTDDLAPLFRILNKYFNLPQFFTLALEPSFISEISQIFLSANFSIKKEITKILCTIIDNSPLDFVPCLIQEHAVQMIYEMYISDANYLKNILLNSFIKLFNSAYSFNQEDYLFFSSEIDEIDFSAFDESQEDEDDINGELIIQLKQMYDEFYNQENNFDGS